MSPHDGSNLFARGTMHCAGLLTGALALLVAASSCGSDSTAPDPISTIPDFIYVSTAAGGAQLYTWHKGTSTPFPTSVAGDIEPQSAAGKVVFTSHRIAPSNTEIFIQNVDGTNPLRLTTQTGEDAQPSLSADGQSVVFASDRSGMTRIWTMGADGSNPTALNTGSSTSISESSPRYSPSGDRILFSSPRTNTTQIWVIPSAGGTATQVTHEANGAFYGSWSSDGNSIFYVDGADRTKIHKVVVSTGDVSDYVTDGTDVGNAACTDKLCLVVWNATSSNRDIYAYFGANDAAPLGILVQPENEYQPAILHR